ncbi:translation initiation factor IF-3 [Caproiciproducens sp. NJN-50]|nr:translation initiation factor IF-3 [Caproiciproducens sp. NJN-50]
MARVFYSEIDVLWRCLAISNKELQINEQIRDRQVRLIGSDGSQLGLMSSAQALQKAMEMNLDLVKIAPQATPPVCKIIDYGKFRFEQAKRDKEARKNQHTVEIKEIRLSLNIDVHDFNTKLGHAEKFLKSGDKVKASIRFRGREMGHPEQGYETMKRFAEALSEIANVEKPPKLEGRNMLMFLASKPVK